MKKTTRFEYDTVPKFFTGKATTRPKRRGKKKAGYESQIFHDLLSTKGMVLSNTIDFPIPSFQI